MMPVTRTHRFGWTLAVASALLCTTQVAAQPMQGRGERAPPFPSTWEAAVRRTVLSPSGLATQISPPGGPLRPRVGEAQKKGLRWGAGIGALAGLTLGIVAAENRECGMDCLLGTPVGSRSSERSEG